MKSVITGVIAGLMLLGTVAAVVTPKQANKTVLASDGGPAPMCYPTEPGCKPPIPPAR